MRINRFLAQCGFGSRRNVEQLIEKERVTVDGVLCVDKATKIEVGVNIVTVDGVKAELQDNQDETWIFNKPPGYLCTREDPKNRKSIYALLGHLPPPYQAVGRLDRNSRGLLIITKNGALSNILMHPRYEIKKQYKVRAFGKWDPSFVQKLADGVEMCEGGVGRMKVINCLRTSEKDIELLLELKEGKKREIRYSLAALNLKVIDLLRIQIDFLNLDGLKEGKSRALNSDELIKMNDLFNRFKK